jgi:bleomycin hydrolase
MKKLLIVLSFAISGTALYAQTAEPYEFKEYKRHAATPVKSQDQTGTCWAFSTASFLESEALRLGKGEVNISEMFVVRNIYRLKCENYVRRQGTANLGEGGLAHDLLHAVERFGIVPESVYPGRSNPIKPFNHSSLEKSLKETCGALVQQGKEGKLDPKWMAQIDALLDQEFGPAPAKFSYNGAVFSPLSYRDFLGIKPQDYVTITSFTHHPFWDKFILEIPDNWSNGEFYNLPLDEMMRCATFAIEQGYTLSWDTDVSNAGFSARNGIAIVPEKPWQDKTAAERTNAFNLWEPEQKITQEYRQQLFDTQETMDDHLMHITGTTDEKHVGIYFIVKNSWGEISDYKGYVYTSEAYMRLNTISYTLPKSALPRDVRRRLGLEPGDVNIENNRKADMQLKPTPATDSTPANAKPNASDSAPQMRPSKKTIKGGKPKE